MLDEPSSNLDGEGDIALAKCIQQIKQAGAAVVMISHQHGTLAVADKLLVLNDGEVAIFGPCAEVMERLKPRRLATASSA